jgi:hypothetical protein
MPILSLRVSWEVGLKTLLTFSWCRTAFLSLRLGRREGTREVLSDEEVVDSVAGGGLNVCVVAFFERGPFDFPAAKSGFGAFVHP